jgi:hypothetical protein
VVTDKAKGEGKRLAGTLHSLQVQNKLLHHKNNGLCAALTTKQKHKKKSKVLDLQQCEEYHGGAVLWSPRKIREARVGKTVKQREEEQEKLQKTHQRELKAAATLYKKQIAEEAKALQQIAKERSNEERKARAAELAAARALKKQQRDAATSQNLAIHQKKANERPHKTLHQNLLRSVVLWVLEVVLVLHLRRHSLYPKPPHAGAKSKYCKNSNNTKDAQGSI